MRRLLALVLVALTVTGCIQDSSSVRPPTQVKSGTGGVFALQSIGGKPLPFLYFQDGADTYEILSNTFELSPGEGGGTYVEIEQGRMTIDGVVTTPTVTNPGTYTLNGTAITFRRTSNGLTFSGTLSSNTMTLQTPLQSGQLATELYTRS